MLKRIEEFEVFVEITGFDNVRTPHIEEFLEKINGEKPRGIEVQFFDAKHVATWRHLYFAALNALTTLKNKQNVSKSLSMETLLHAACSHQIARATERMGIKPASQRLAVLIIGENRRIIDTALSIVSKSIDGKRDEKVLALSKEKTATIQKALDISKSELLTVMGRDDAEHALVDLVIEKMALLPTEH